MTVRISCVCLGNICRSPMAAAVLRARLSEAGLGDQVTVASSGTGGWHVGDGADPRARATLAAAGYDDNHRAAQFHPDDFATFDLILAMDHDNVRDLQRMARTTHRHAGHVRLLRSFDPDAAPQAEVPDPYYGGADGFDEVLAMIESAAGGVIDDVRRRLAT